MGKGNRNRLAKAQQAAGAESVFTANSKKKNQTPAWVSTVAIILIAVLLIGCVALSVISEGGYLLRWTTVAESEHYSVSGTMLSYYFYQNYSYFLGTYGSLASYMGLDTGSSLKTQSYGDDGETWFDYFMDSVVSEINQILVYCEEARARDIKLDDDDYADIDAAIDTIKENAAEYGYTVNGYISGMYGTGVKEADIRKALELSQLASKASQVISDEFTDGVTDDEINSYFNENPANFLTASLLTYTTSVDKPDEGEDSTEYDATVAENKAFGETLAACKTADEFKKAVLEHIATGEFEDIFEDVAEDYVATELPDSATLAERKPAIIANAIELALAGKSATATTETATSEIILSKVEVELTTTLTSTLEDMVDDSYSWTDSEDDAEGLWVSDSDRKVGDVKYFDNSSDEEADDFTVTVHMVTETMHRDDQPTRNVGHILFDPDEYANDAGAKAKAEEILEQLKSSSVTKESFEAVANEYTADSGVFYDNVVPGQMVTSFDEWLFDEERQVGDLDIVETDYGYHVMYYLGEDAEWPVWKVTGRSYVVNEHYETWYESAKESYKVTVHEAKLDKVSA